MADKIELKITIEDLNEWGLVWADTNVQKAVTGELLVDIPAAIANFLGIKSSSVKCHAEFIPETPKS